MATRSVHWAIEAILAPVLKQMVTEGELESITVGVRLDGIFAALRISGEEFELPVWTRGVDIETDAEVRERAASDLQDHIAESRFGWGELRQYREQ